MKKTIIIVAVTILLIAVFVPAYAVDSETKYSATSFQVSSCPSGAEYIPLNLTSTGNIVKITGTGFGNRDVSDSTPEMIYIPINNELKMVYRGSRVEGETIYFGLLSWTDNEITIEVVPGTENLLGSYIILRTFTDANDHQGTCNRGTLNPSKETTPIDVLFKAIHFLRADVDQLQTKSEEIQNTISNLPSPVSTYFGNDDILHYYYASNGYVYILKANGEVWRYAWNIGAQKQEGAENFPVEIEDIVSYNQK